MQLTDNIIQNTQATEKPLKLSDGKSLYLLIMPNGSRYWRVNCRINKKQQTIALGVYPIVGITEARQRNSVAKQHIKAGNKPSFKHYDRFNNYDSSKYRGVPDEALIREIEQRGFSVKNLNYKQVSLFGS